MDEIERVITDTDFVSAEALKFASNTNNTEARAKFLIAAQMGNLVKAIIHAGDGARSGLRWISDSLDGLDLNVQAATKPTQENEEEEEEEEEDSKEGGGDEEGENVFIDGELKLIPRQQNIRKRYVRTSDGLRLERVP